MLTVEQFAILAALCCGLSIGGLTMWAYMGFFGMLRTRDEYMAWREREIHARNRHEEEDDADL